MLHFINNITKVLFIIIKGLNIHTLKPTHYNNYILRIYKIQSSLTFKSFQIQSNYLNFRSIFA